MSVNSNPSIRIQTLGTHQLIVDNQAVKLYSTKVWSLIVYLALHPDQPCSREVLATLFWGEKTDKKARASLRQALYSIKQSVGKSAENLLRIERDTVTFCQLDDVSIDVLDLIEAYNHEQYDAVVKLYDGTLCETLSLPDCEEYEAWLYLQRHNVEQKALTALIKTINQLLSHNDSARALPLAQKLQAIDPLNEEGHRFLMRIYAMNGDLTLACRQYQVCVTLLEQELGVEPTIETTELFDQLEYIEQTPITNTTNISIQDKFIQFPLVQREAEMQLIEQLWLHIPDQTDNLIVIRGETGIGKSRLIQELIQQTHIQNTLIGHCFEIEMNTPYSVWSDLLQKLVEPEWQDRIDELESPWLQHVSRIVPTLTNLPISQMDGMSQNEKRLLLLQSVVRCLAHLATQPMLVIFEDIHWADHSSIELLHYATRQLVNHPILFVVSLDKEVQGTHTNQLLQGLKNKNHIIDLMPLDSAAVAQLVDIISLSISDDLTHELARFSGGNPYVLIETLRAIKARATGSEEITIQSLNHVTSNVSQLVLERLNSVGEEHQRIVETLAISHHFMSINLLCKVTGIDEFRMLGYIEALLAKGFLIEDERHATINIHDNYIRQVLVDNLRPIRKTALHRRIAEALIHLPSATIEEIAFHFLNASDERAISYLLKAGDQAHALYALYEAKHFYHQALSFINDKTPHDYSLQLDILLKIEEIHSELGERGEQADVISELEKLATLIASPEITAHVHVRQAGLLTYTSQFEEAHRILLNALAFYKNTHDIDEEANSLREMGFLQWANGQFTLALKYNRDALQLYRKADNVNGQATALHNLAEIHRNLNSPQQAINFYHQSQEMYWAGNSAKGFMLSWYGLGHSYEMLEKFDQAQHAFNQAQQECEKLGDRRMLSRVFHSMATLHWNQSARETALDYLNRAVKVSRDIGYSHGISHSLWLLSLYYVQCGRLNDAKHAMNQVIEWLEFAEDYVLLPQAKQWMLALDNNRTDQLQLKLPSNLNWVRSHITVAEGKVYCEFESPAVYADFESL